MTNRSFSFIMLAYILPSLQYFTLKINIEHYYKINRDCSQAKSNLLKMLPSMSTSHTSQKQPCSKVQLCNNLNFEQKSQECDVPISFTSISRLKSTKIIHMDHQKNSNKILQFTYIIKFTNYIKFIHSNQLHKNSLLQIINILQNNNCSQKPS